LTIENYFTIVADHVKKIVAILENYCVFASSVYDDYIIGCIGGWNYKHADVQNLPLLDRLHNIVLEAEQIIENADISEEEKLVLTKRFAQVSTTVVHMKAVKLNYEMHNRITTAEIRKFAGARPPIQIEKFTLYTPEYNPPVIVPEDVKKKIKALDPNSIPDTFDYDNFYK
jgi:hypothetical protein